MKVNTNKVKRIIAREGLIILGLATFTFVLYSMSGVFSKFSVNILAYEPSAFYEAFGYGVDHSMATTLKTKEYQSTFIHLGLLLYSVYLIIRFIIWADKTLKSE